MDEITALQAVLDAVEAAGLPYMVVGSLSSNAYGIARSTNDADIVLRLTPEGLRQLGRRLPAELQLDPQSTFETITGKTRHVIRLRHLRFMIDLFELGDGAFDQSRFARRREDTIEGRQRYVQTAEDVVLQKLMWYRRAKRSKDIDDVRTVIAVQQQTLDWEYLRRWADEHGTRPLLEEIHASLPGE